MLPFSDFLTQFVSFPSPVFGFHISTLLYILFCVICLWEQTLSQNYPSVTSAVQKLYHLLKHFLKAQKNPKAHLI